MGASKKNPAAAPDRRRAAASCPSCGSAARAFFRIDDVPVNSCVLLPTPEEALAYPKGDVSLAFCDGCGFIFNEAFDPGLVNYGVSYEDQQSFSATFNAFAESLARDLVGAYDIQNRSIVEIGCGKGDFLLLLCRLGANRGVGIDPSWIDGRLDAGDASVRFIRDAYSKAHGNLSADFVCCRHTLEHIPDVGAFMGSVRDGVAKRSGTLAFFEVPDTVRVLEESAFWDVYYEHCSYFTPGSLARLFRNGRFQVLVLRRAFGEQYLLLEGRSANGAVSPPLSLEEPLEDLGRLVERFAKSSRRVMDGWQDRIRTMRRVGKKIAVWGSGSKCVAFLTSLDLQEEVARVVDINPHRHGLYIPGSGHRIDPPGVLASDPPDVVVIMNPVYKEEIGAMLREMGLSPRILALGESVPPA